MKRLSEAALSQKISFDVLDRSSKWHLMFFCTANRAGRQRKTTAANSTIVPTLTGRCSTTRDGPTYCAFLSLFRSSSSSLRDFLVYLWFDREELSAMDLNLRIVRTSSSRCCIIRSDTHCVRFDAAPLYEDGAVIFINKNVKPEPIFQQKPSPEVEEAWEKPLRGKSYSHPSTTSNCDKRLKTD